MRVALVLLVVVSLLAPPRAVRAQCFACGPGLRCLSTNQPVARACLELPPGVCLLTGACSGGGGGRFIDSMGESVVGLTLIEPSGSVTPPPRALPRVGRALVGREAARALRERMAPTAPDGDVVFGTLVHGAVGATLVFKSPQGDGFSVRRDREGPLGARLTVRQLEHGRPERVLASDRMGDEDLLIVPVRFDGRVRVVALQALRLSPADRDRQLEPLRAALAELPSPGAELPFEAEVIDD